MYLHDEGNSSNTDVTTQSVVTDQLFSPTRVLEEISDVSNRDQTSSGPTAVKRSSFGLKESQPCNETLKRAAATSASSETNTYIVEKTVGSAADVDSCTKAVGTDDRNSDKFWNSKPNQDKQEQRKGMLDSGESNDHQILMCSVDNFDEWKIRMWTHLAATHMDMMEVITNGPIKVMKVNTNVETAAGIEAYVAKPKAEWTSEDKERYNLDNIAQNIISQNLDSHMILKIRDCKTAKEIWDRLILICEGTDAIKDNKLTMVIQKFESFKMKAGETIEQMDSRFSAILDELNMLGKTYSQKEICLKILRGLPAEWSMKTIAMRESRNLAETSTFRLFYDLKEYEFELNNQEVLKTNTQKGPAVNNNIEQLQEQMALLLKEVKKLSKLLRNQQKGESSERYSRNDDKHYHKKDDHHSRKDENMLCYNCNKLVNLKADRPVPVVTKHRDDDKKYKSAYKRKGSRAMKAEESSSSSSDDSSTSESADEELLCLRAQDEDTEHKISNSRHELNSTRPVKRIMKTPPGSKKGAAGTSL